MRTVLGHFATGITIVTASTTASPSAWRATRSRRCRSILRSSCSVRRSRRRRGRASRPPGKWAANILGEDDEEVCRLFAEKDADRFAHMTFRPGVSGAPMLDRTLAFFDCVTEAEHDAGDHVIVVGQRPRARLPVGRQAAALLPRRVRPVRELSRGRTRARSSYRSRRDVFGGRTTKLASERTRSKRRCRDPRRESAPSRRGSSRPANSLSHSRCVLARESDPRHRCRRGAGRVHGRARARASASCSVSLLRWTASSSPVGPSSVQRHPAGTCRARRARRAAAGPTVVDRRSKDRGQRR